MATIKNFPNNADEYIGAEDVMKWLHGRTSGVFAANENLAVTAGDGMSVNVSDGLGWLADSGMNGSVFWNDTKESTGSPLNLEIELSDALNPRVDRVVVSWKTVDYADKPEITIKKGTAKESPTPPDLTNSKVKREISLAKILIPAAASKIEAANITDERLNSEVCGLVTDSIEIDTTTANQQFSDFLTKISNEFNNLNTGTETMLKTQYDPNGAGLTFDDVKTNQANIASNASAISELQTAQMKKSVYDASGAVQAAGGIAGYVDGQVRAVDGKLNNLQNEIRYITVVLWPDRWEGNSAPYTYTVPISGMTASFVPGIPWLKGFADIATDDLKHRLEEVKKIQKIDTTDGKVIITCLEEKPDHVLDLCIPGEVDSGTIYDPYT